MHERLTSDVGYSGNVIQFHETPSDVYAIHRIWKLNPEQKREERIRSQEARDRVITKGCINVEEDVFDMLLDCCVNDQLLIRN